MYDNIHIRELIFDEICAVFIDSKESFSFSYRDLIDRKSSKYVALGFILGDSTIIPKNNYHYIEVKSTKLPTIIAAYIHLRNIIYDENYLYLNCSKSGHGVLDYHIRIKSKEPLLDYIRKVKKTNDMSALRCLLGESRYEGTNRV